MNLQVMIIVVALAAGTVVGVLLWPLIRYLRSKAILDHPNERSSHHIATPKGAGLIVVPVICIAWLGICWAFDRARLADILPLIGGGGLIFVVSWIDDLKGLSAIPRLATHVLAAASAVWLSPGISSYLVGIVGGPLGMILTVILWVWFINLFNFMDGIDGITGVNTTTICIGIALVVILAGGSDTRHALYASVVAGVALGFLIWNVPPARLFLGDVGSAPLGFFVGWLLLSLLQSENYVAALILPGYYLADATLTLLKRAARQEKIWQAHREHFYQLAVRRGTSHARVCIVILAANTGLISLALMGTLWGTNLVLAGAGVLVTILLVYLGGGRSVS
jgi:UDP-N-acetylmuramyl pentapeptide phosphotransferase/UDP-N-acetylglucosamine-1-phosphate transferase